MASCGIFRSSVRKSRKACCQILRGFLLHDSVPHISLWARYKLRWKRRRYLWRAFRKRHDLAYVHDQTGVIAPADILLFATLRNEMMRLPYFLEHYRRMGVAHFLIIENDSDDGTSAYLARQPDVSLWHTKASYKASRFGVDWVTWLMRRFGHGHWTLTVDADELFIYPDYPNQSLPQLTRKLEQNRVQMMGALMLDLYPKGPVDAQHYAPGQNPCDVLQWFDATGYRQQVQPKMGNLWLQGGPRARLFFAKDPKRAPTLNKIPLVKWHRSYVYVNSTHNALPAWLNQTYATKDAIKPTGALLHTKFLPGTADRATQEQERKEHFSNSELYDGYYAALTKNPDFWTEDATFFEGPEQLEALGLMARGPL